MAGIQPRKKPFGRNMPPKGYPRNPSVYADPQNWRYPLHTAWHAQAARRYFDDPANRNKYSGEEQVYIDGRINKALKRFRSKGKAVKIHEQPAIPSQLETMTLLDLLRSFLGPARLDRARHMDDSLVSIDKENSDVIEGRVKEYIVRIDVPNRTIVHNCQDWQNNMASKQLCKHLGKLFLVLDDGKSTSILRQMLREKDLWSFTSPATD